MRSIKDIYVSSKPGKNYWVNCHREYIPMNLILGIPVLAIVSNWPNSADCRLNKTQKWMKPVYGSTSNVEIQHSEDPANPVCYILLYLRPMKLVILKKN